MQNDGNRVGPKLSEKMELQDPASGFFKLNEFQGFENNFMMSGGMKQVNKDFAGETFS